MTQIATTTTHQFNSFNAIKDAYAKQLKTPKGAIKGMFAILKHQLESEKQTKQTRFYNKVGYTIYDARSLTTYANKIEAGIKLSGEEFSDMMHRVQKYARQLAKHAIVSGKITKIHKGLYTF